MKRFYCKVCGMQFDERPDECPSCRQPEIEDRQEEVSEEEDSEEEDEPADYPRTPERPPPKSPRAPKARTKKRK